MIGNSNKNFWVGRLFNESVSRVETYIFLNVAWPCGRVGPYSVFPLKIITKFYLIHVLQYQSSSHRVNLLHTVQGNACHDENLKQKIVIDNNSTTHYKTNSTLHIMIEVNITVPLWAPVQWAKTSKPDFTRTSKFFIFI